MAKIHGIEIEEDALAAAIFCNATLETTGACTALDARKASRVMLAAPETAAERDRLQDVAAALVLALRQAVIRVELANSEGNPILSAWLPDARAALRKAEGGAA